MNKRIRNTLFNYCSRSILLLFHTLLFSLIWYNHYLPQLAIPFYRRGSYVILVLFFLFLTISNQLFGGLRLGHYKTLDSIVVRTLALFTSYFMIYLVICLLAYRFLSITYILFTIGGGFIFNCLWTCLSNHIYYVLNPPQQMLLIYGNSSVSEISDKITARKEKYNITHQVHYSIGEEQLKEMITAYDSVILHDLSASLRNHLIKYCYETSTPVYITPKLYDILIRGATVMDLFDTPLLLMKNEGISPLQACIKRSMDIFVSLLGLIVLSPIMLIIVLLMKCFDPGPVLYRQTRLTLHGKPFRILKFRSMCVDAEKDSIQLMSKSDDRITPLGKLLRRTHLDELPQLINILKGEMSLVGPRPERPEIAAVYEETIPEFSYRLHVKAGLTGYAQVYGKYNSTPYDKLKLDLTYIQNYSVFLDIKLLFMTGRTLFLPDHAEGINPNFKTALRTEAEPDSLKNK